MWVALRPSAHAQTAPTIPTGGASGQIYLTDLKFTPKKITLTWNNSFVNTPLSPPGTDPDTDPTAPTTVFVARVWGTLYRTPSGTAVSTSGDWTNVATTSGEYCSSGTSTWTDTAWALDTQYTYYLTGGDITWQWIAGSGSTPGLWVLQSSPVTGDPYCVTVRKTAVSANQTVDTRVDPRYEVPPLKNYQFATSLYRGGLFSGYNADSAQVARTYLKFTGLSGPITTGQQLWAVGGIWVYATRQTKTGSASVTCTSVPDNTWDPTTLVWGNAPTPNGYGCGPVSVSWDSTNPIEQWVELPVVPAIEHAMTTTGTTSGTLSLVIRAADESGSGTGTTASAGWTYWARNSYHEPSSTATWTGTLQDGQFHPGGSHGLDLSAYLLYAYGGSGAVALQGLTFTPTSISSLSSSTGTLQLTYPAPAGGLTVTLTSSNASVLSCPSTLTIPGGQTFATFYVTSGSVTGSQTATITATFDDSTASGTVTVTPGTGTGGGGTGTGGGGTGGGGTGTGGGGTGGGGTGGGGTGGPPGGPGGGGGPPGP